MNLPRIYLIVILLLAFGVCANGQELPKAVLVDKFGEISCEDLLSRTDHFFTELMNNPSDIGQVILSSNSKYAKNFRAWINGNIYTRKFDRSKLRILFSAKPSEVAGQFWRIPPGAEAPKIEELGERPTDTSKPFVFGSADENDICPTFLPDIYADLIKQNPGSHGKIIVSGPNWLSRKSFADNYVQNLLRTQGLARKQLRVFYIHRSNNSLTDAEFWFMPAEKK